MDKDTKKFIKTNIAQSIHTAKSLLSLSVGEEVIIYGIGICMVPTADNNGLLIMEDDREFTDDIGNLYVLIREKDVLYQCIVDRVFTLLTGKKLFVRGIIVDKKSYSRNINNKVENYETILIAATHSIRVVLDDFPGKDIS